MEHKFALVVVFTGKFNNLLLDKKITRDESQNHRYEVMLSILVEDELGGENAVACRSEIRGGFQKKHSYRNVTFVFSSF